MRSTPIRFVCAAGAVVTLLALSWALGFVLGTIYDVALISRTSAVLGSGDDGQDLSQEAGRAAKNILTSRLKMLTGGSEEDLKKFYDTSTTGGLFAYEKENLRLEYTKKWLEERGCRFEDLTSVFELDDATKIDDDTYWLELTEHSTYTLEYGDDRSGRATHTFGSRAVHVIEIQRQGQSWRVRTDWYCDPLGSGGAMPEKGQYLLKRDFDAAAGNDANRHYSGQDAADYAVAHSGVKMFPGSGRYNPDYRIYTFKGGDCANFVSQSLLAGGLEEGYGWHYYGEGSTAWVRSEDLVWYLLSTGRAEEVFVGSFREAMTPDENGRLPIHRLHVGDVIGYEKRGEISHVALVTGKDAAGNPTITSHTADRVHFPWDLGWGTDTRYWFIHIVY